MRKRPTSSGCWLEHGHALHSLCSVQQQSLPSLGDGRDYCRLPQPGPLLPACLLCRSPIPPMLTASHLCSATSSLTPPSHLPLPPAWRSACVSSAPPEPSLHWDRVDLSLKGLWGKKKLEYYEQRSNCLRPARSRLRQGMTGVKLLSAATRACCKVSTAE